MGEDVKDCNYFSFIISFTTFTTEIKTMKSYRDIITINPNVRSGKPIIRNLRITFADVLGYLASGMSELEIIADFPKLTIEDIRACLSYAADSEKHVTFAPVK